MADPTRAVIGYFKWDCYVIPTGIRVLVNAQSEI